MFPIAPPQFQAGSLSIRLKQASKSQRGYLSDLAFALMNHVLAAATYIRSEAFKGCERFRKAYTFFLRDAPKLTDVWLTLRVHLAAAPAAPFGLRLARLQGVRPGGRLRIQRS